MTIASDLVTRAYRELNLIPAGDSPTTAEAAEGLTLLNNIVNALFGGTVGENLREWLVPPPQRTAPVKAQFPIDPPEEDMGTTVYPYPPPNVRLMVSITTATTIYFPHNPPDGARMSLANVGMGAVTLTLDGNGRKIEAATTVAVTNSATTKRWFYRGDTGNWVLLATLVDSDTPPLPEEYDDYLAIGVAIRLAPRHGKVVPAESIATYTAQKKAIKARYKQPTAASGRDDFTNSKQTYGNSSDSWMT